MSGRDLLARAHIPAPQPPQEKQDPHSHFHMDTLLMTTHNLLFGGTETVGTTLRHAFLVLMKYPKVQGARAPSLPAAPRATPAPHACPTGLSSLASKPRPACQTAQSPGLRPGPTAKATNPHGGPAHPHGSRGPHSLPDPGPRTPPSWSCFAAHL